MAGKATLAYLAHCRSDGKYLVLVVKLIGALPPTMCAAASSYCNAVAMVGGGDAFAFSAAALSLGTAVALKRCARVRHCLGLNHERSWSVAAWKLLSFSGKSLNLLLIPP